MNTPLQQPCCLHVQEEEALAALEFQSRQRMWELQQVGGLGERRVTDWDLTASPEHVTATAAPHKSIGAVAGERWQLGSARKVAGGRAVSDECFESAGAAACGHLK